MSSYQFYSMKKYIIQKWDNLLKMWALGLEHEFKLVNSKNKEMSTKMLILVLNSLVPPTLDRRGNDIFMRRFRSDMRDVDFKLKVSHLSKSERARLLFVATTLKDMLLTSRLELEYNNLIEVVNRDYTNAKLKEVIRFHRGVIKYIDELFRLVNLDIRAFSGNMLQNSYGGSYHVWFTLPPIKNVPRDRANCYAISLLQWMEPMLFVHKQQNLDNVCKGTYRMCLNNDYAAFGTVNPKRLLGKNMTFGELLNKDCIDYYDITNNTFEVVGQVRVKSDVLNKNVTVDGSDLKFVDSITRIHSYIVAENVTYIDQIERVKGEIAGLVGNDIRVDTSFTGQGPVVVKNGEDLQIGYYEYKTDTLFPYGEKETLKSRMFAFEVRIFDNSTLTVMESKIKDILLIFERGVELASDDWCFEHPVWHDAMATALLEGPEAVLSDAYINKINTLLGVDVKNQPINAYWEEAFEIMFNKYSSGTYYRSFHK